MPGADYDVGPGALEAADEAARELAEGRYAGVVADRPGMLERVVAVARRETWAAHLHGWACQRCGPSVHSRRAQRRHEWWHRWLEAMFAAVGNDVDALEGEVAELRADLRGLEVQSAEAVAQVRVLAAMLSRAVGGPE